MSLEEEILAKVKPSAQEYIKLREAVNEVLGRLEDLRAEVHGSFAKDTWLSGNSDVDVFVFFSPQLGLKWLREDSLALLKERLEDLPIRLEYADHPYLRVRVKDVWIDVVPAALVDEGSHPITPVDRTRFHTEFINNNLTQYQKDQVRLLKAFMKGIGVYGAEQRVRGFSGYLTELLIYHYSTFHNLLSAASDWGGKVIVDSPSREFPEPLVVPDPVDPKRNVAAAVSVKRLAEFVLAARAYIDSPSENFFFPQMVKDGIVKGDVFVIELTPTAIVPKEVLWGQINNAMSKIKKFLIQAGFRVVDVNAWGEVIIAVQLESKEIGKYKLQQGPPFYMRNDASAFLQAHDAVWIGEDGRLQAIVERETDPFVISRRALDFSFPYRVQFRWIKSGEDIWLAQFLRKRPSWLR